MVITRYIKIFIRRPYMVCLVGSVIAVLTIFGLVALFDTKQKYLAEMPSGSDVMPMQFHHSQAKYYERKKIVVYPEKLNKKGVGCTAADIDPFHKEMMDYMKDFKDLHCNQPHELNVTTKSDKLLVSGFSIDYIQSAEIVHDDQEGYKLLEYEYLLQPRVSQPILLKGKTGALQNRAVNRCIFPEKYEFNNPPTEINLIYSENCASDEAKFFFSEDGVLKHNITGKCVGPKGGSENPPKDTPLILMDSCVAKFDTIYDGVLKHVGGGSCVHPLGGGTKPEEGQQLCLYPDCKAEGRLTYRWHVVNIGALGKTSEEFPISKELNHIQIRYTDDTSAIAYALNVKPKQLTAPESNKSPNILIIAIAETSSSHFTRKLSSSYKYMKEELQFDIFALHAAISESIKENVMAMIQGVTPADIMGSSLYILAKQKKYATMFSADKPVYFSGVKIDSHHSALPLFKSLKKHHSVCVSTQPIYDLSFDYLLSFINSYPKTPKFGIVLLNVVTEENYNVLGYMDKKFKHVLETLKTLENTFIIVHSIKGSLTGKLSQVKQGVLEHRRPLLATYVSADIRSKYTVNKDRMKELSTPYDMYSTVRELLSGEKKDHAFGKSLFDKIEARNCKEAGVDTTMCPCV